MELRHRTTLRLLPVCLAMLLGGAGCATKGDVTAVEQKAAALAEDNRKAVGTLGTNVDRRFDELQARVNAEAKKGGDAAALLTTSLEQTRAELATAAQSVAAHEQRIGELREAFDREIGALRVELGEAKETLTRVASESAATTRKVDEAGEETRRQIASMSRELGTKISSGAEQVTELRARIAKVEESVADVIVRIRATILYQQNALKDQAASMARSIRDFDDTLSTFDDLFPETQAKRAAEGGATSAASAPSAATGSANK